MPAKAIPERAPVCDVFTGVLVQASGGFALSTLPQSGGEVVAGGDFEIRYGVCFLGKPEQYIVPELVVMDYGDMLTGEDAWNFLWHRSNLHPRSEVVGPREDGREDIVFFRSLDLSLPPRVLVYERETLLAKAAALIATETAGLPPRLLEFLPCFISVEDWLASS